MFHITAGDDVKASRGDELSPAPRALTLLSVIIPARNEEDCIASTVEHLHLELRLHEVPHEIVVVDDGSVDGTWSVLTRAPSENCRAHNFEERASAWLRSSG